MLKLGMSRRARPPGRAQDGGGPEKPPKNSAPFPALIVLTLVVGLLLLALVDESYRPAFADLVKAGVAGYVGWVMPSPHSADN